MKNFKFSTFLKIYYHSLECCMKKLPRLLETISHHSQMIILQVKHLRTFGGKKADDFIPRALAFAMTDRFAISFTWEGQGNKNKFEDLQFKKVLMSEYP